MPLRIHVDEQDSLVQGEECRKVDGCNRLSAAAFLVHDRDCTHRILPQPLIGPLRCGAQGEARQRSNGLLDTKNGLVLERYSCGVGGLIRSIQKKIPWNFSRGAIEVGSRDREKGSYKRGPGLHRSPERAGGS